jgi:hypothetical protein
MQYPPLRRGGSACVASQDGGCTSLMRTVRGAMMLLQPNPLITTVVS